MLQTFIFIRFCVVLLGIGIVPLSLPWIAPGATVTQGSPSACGGGKQCCQGRKNSVGNGGDQDSFLGLAVTQICGDPVLRSTQWRTCVGTGLGDLARTLAQMRGKGQITPGPHSQQLVFAYSSFAGVKWRSFVGTRQTVETKPEPGCCMCLAAHAMAHSRQPLPPTNFACA